MYIRDEGKGVLLTDVPEFCIGTKSEETLECVTTFDSSPPDCVRADWFSLIIAAVN